MHARPVRVENAGDLDIELMLTVVVEKKRFRAAFTFVITRPDADRVDVAPIALHLRVNDRITVDLARRCLKNAALEPLGEPEHVDRAMHRGFGGLHRIMLIMHWRRRARKVVNFVDLDEQRKCHIVADKFESWIAKQMRNVALGACEQVVQANHLVAIRKQTITQV